MNPPLVGTEQLKRIFPFHRCKDGCGYVPKAIPHDWPIAWKVESGYWLWHPHLPLGQQIEILSDDICEAEEREYSYWKQRYGVKLSHQQCWSWLREKVDMPKKKLDRTEILNRVDMLRLVLADVHGEGRRSGKRLTVRCPFHDDHRPSLTVDLERKTWRCWPEDIGGTAIDWVMRRDGCDFITALNELDRIF